ncbi:MAG: TonB-dependent receptor [Proteobacteria bacterium]|nr:TonB-dependent receptor [Pseudomonadota bacterium]
MTSELNRRPVRRFSATLAAAVGALLGAAAHAETAPVDTGALAEVVVTAQKRTESLQSVPVSVTALTANQLGELKMDTPSDLTTQIPNLQVNGIVGEGSPIFSLRGVSMFDYSLSQSSPVASYIDEVYKGNFVLFGVEMYDLQRVEVLRGPQGTLYGKNTTGGAINFVTRRPGFDTEGDIKVGVGNFGRQEAEGAFQTALVADRLAMRVAFSYTKQDGFIRNVLPGHPDMEGVNQYGVRLSLLYKVSDDFDAILRLSKSMQDPQNYAIIAGNIGAAGVGGAGYFRTVDGNLGSAALATDQVAQDYTPKRRQDNEGVALTLDWRLNSTLQLTSITSWDLGKLFNPEGTDGSPIDIFKIPYIGKTKQVAQDLRLTSNTGGAFDYIVGAYYQHEVIYNSTENQFFNFLDFNGDGQLNYHDCADASFAPADAGTGTGYPSGIVINPSCRYYNQFDQIRNSWSAYSDASYKLSETFKLHAGVRYNHDNGSQLNALDQLRGPDGVPIANLGFSTDPNTFMPALVLPGSPGYDAAVNATRRQDIHNTAVTGRAGIDYTPTKDALIYLGYSRGYRSAAFNAQFLFTPQDFTSVKPETLDSVEAGFKTAWLDNRLQLNGAVFHYQYKNQQYIDVQPTGQQPLINLQKSKIDGGELELVTRPVRDFTLRLGLGFLDGKIQEGAISGGAIDVSGHKLPNAPDASATLSMDWDALHFGESRLTLHFDGSYASKQYFELLNEDRIAQDAYAILNARIAYRAGGDKWEVGLWGRNLANKYYLTNAVDLQALGYDYEHRGLPRMFGLDASYHF